jgi:hypothetical protein
MSDKSNNDEKIRLRAIEKLVLFKKPLSQTVEV